jgi:hypothetical protein
MNHKNTFPFHKNQHHYKQSFTQISFPYTFHIFKLESEKNESNNGNAPRRTSDARPGFRTGEGHADFSRVVEKSVVAPPATLSPPRHPHALPCDRPSLGRGTALPGGVAPPAARLSATPATATERPEARRARLPRRQGRSGRRRGQRSLRRHSQARLP